MYNGEGIMRRMNSWKRGGRAGGPEGGLGLVGLGNL